MEKPNLVIDKEQRKVFIDGEKVAKLIIDNDRNYHIIFEANQIHSFSNITIDGISKKHIKSIQINLETDFFHHKLIDIISDNPVINLNIDNDYMPCYISFDLDLSNWALSFSAKTFFKELEKSFENNKYFSFPPGYIINKALTVKVNFFSRERKLKELFYRINAT